MRTRKREEMNCKRAMYPVWLVDLNGEADPCNHVLVVGPKPGKYRIVGNGMVTVYYKGDDQCEVKFKIYGPHPSKPHSIAVQVKLVPTSPWQKHLDFGKAEVWGQAWWLRQFLPTARISRYRNLTLDFPPLWKVTETDPELWPRVTCIPTTEPMTEVFSIDDPANQAD
jgi:hypothetical protein